MKRQVDLSTYWPPMIKNTREFQMLSSTESVELSEAWNNTELVLQNQFLFDATEYGVQRWEKMLGIIPETGSTLDARKWRIYLLMNDQPPYTYRMLVQRLNEMLGEDGFKISVWPDQYTLQVTLSQEWRERYGLLADLLYRILPANMAGQIKRHAITSNTLYVASRSGSRTYSASKPESNKQLETKINLYMAARSGMLFRSTSFPERERQNTTNAPLIIRHGSGTRVKIPAIGVEKNG